MEGQKDYKYQSKVITEDPFIHIHCKNCDEPIPTENINLNKTLAKCDHCNALFSFDDEIFFENRRGRPEFIMPEGTEVLELLSSLEIELSWFKSMKRSNIAFEVFFTVFWNFIVLTMLVAMLFAGGGIGILFLSVHLIVGLSLAYRLFSKFFNKTLIKISNRKINIEHAPFKLFMPKDTEIHSDDIAQLYVSEYFTGSSQNGKKLTSYGLYVILKSGKKIRIIKNCNKETALYLEQEIERYLKIEDKPVSGETVE